MLCLCVLFFFKQKTADEMRISDWSSDVCSSDLAFRRMPPRRKIHRHIRKPRPVLQYLPAMLEPPVVGLSARRVDGGVHRIEHPADEDRAVDRRRARAFQNARQVMKRQTGPGRGEVEEKFDARGHAQASAFAFSQYWSRSSRL